MLSLGGLMLAVTVVAHNPGYDTALARHLQRWLRDERVEAKVVDSAGMQAALRGERLAFLLGFSSPTEAEMRALREYRARGGRLVVFHSPSAALGELMGVRPLGYAKAPRPGAWSRMDFAADRPAGCPARLEQTSSVLERAVPLPGRARVLATWSDRAGRPTGDAAWIASDAGFWMTHVLLPEGDEAMKGQLCAALAGAVDPLAWSPAAHNARAKAEHARTRALALRQVPRKGEIHAVWDHTGKGLHPGDWARTIRALRESRITDLFVNAAGFGFAHYPSDVLPRSRTFAEEGDQLAACLAAARESGIRVHAWVLCFTATRGSPEVQADCARRGWRLRNAKGALTEYVDPANAQVRARVLAAIDEMQRRYPALAGVHLDFVRWGDGTAKPKDAARTVTEFVAAARRRVARPRWLTAAVFGKYPACVASVGQDWSAWLDAGLIDYAVPMDYSESSERLEGYLAQQGANPRHAARTIAGLGVTANESRLDARQVIEQINMSRRHGLAGNALFDLDAHLAERILPYLRLGIW